MEEDGFCATAAPKCCTGFALDVENRSNNRSRLAGLWETVAQLKYFDPLDLCALLLSEQTLPG